MKLQIKASILLGFFSLMLLHQMIPHLHHEHKEVHDHSLTEHTHSHDHQQENEFASSSDFFSVLLAMHSHGGSNSEVPVVKVPTEHITPKKVKAEKPLIQVFLHQSALSEDPLADLIGNYQPPPKYFRPYLSYLSLRGPPQLV